jgi:hypothetical protein
VPIWRVTRVVEERDLERAFWRVSDRVCGVNAAARADLELYGRAA